MGGNRNLLLIDDVHYLTQEVIHIEHVPMDSGCYCLIQARTSQSMEKDSRLSVARAKALVA